MELRLPELRDETAFRAAVRSFELSDPDWEFAFLYDHAMDFAQYVSRVCGWSRGEGLDEGFVPNSYLLAFVAGELVGRVSIRHRLNDFLMRVGGHIGYGVVPDHRRKGYGAQILAAALPLARSLGIEHALLTCDDDNVASIKIIEGNGGVLNALVTDSDTPVAKRRYFIDLR